MIPTRQAVLKTACGWRIKQHARLERTRRLTIVLWMAMVTATVRAGAIDEADLAQRETECVSRVFDARLAWATWELEQLVVLRTAGHAAWLEVAEKRADVDILSARRTGARLAAEFAQSLRDRVIQAHDLIDSEGARASGEDLPVIKTYVPGSFRLVGWHPAADVCADARRHYLIGLVHLRSQLAAAKSRGDTAAQRVADYEDKVQRLSGGFPSQRAAQSLQRTRLQLALAKARLDLAQITELRDRRDLERMQCLARYHATRMIDDPLAAESAQVIRHDPVTPGLTDRAAALGSALGGAALRVAAAEARQMGEIRAAEVNVTQQKERLDALQQLRRQSTADAHVARARDELESAECTLQRLLSRRSGLQESLDLLRRQVDDEPPETDWREGATTPPSGSVTNGFWDLSLLPASALTDADVVRQLVELACQRYEAEALRQASLVELGLRRQLAARLQKADELLAMNQNLPVMQRSRDGLPFALHAGRRRELRRTGLQIKYIEARVLAAKERWDVACLEWQRFARQIHQQQVTGSASYVESPGTFRMACTRQPSRGGWSDAAAWIVTGPSIRRHVSRIAHDTWLQPQSQLRPCGISGRGQARLSVSISARLDANRLDCLRGACSARSPDPRTRWYVPSYADYYTFGIRRIDFRAPASRKRATAYGGPWYFPGASTNFRE